MKRKIIASALVLSTLISMAGCMADKSKDKDRDSYDDDEEVEEVEETEDEYVPGYARQLREGDTAPDFTIELANGETFTLSENEDKVVMINFWATWCPYCIDEMPAFERIANENLSNFEFIAIDQCENKAMVDRFIEEHDYSFNFGYDPDGVVYDLYPTDGIPYTLIIKDGVVKRLFLGAPNEPYETYMNAIRDCMG